MNTRAADGVASHSALLIPSGGRSSCIPKGCPLQSRLSITHVGHSFSQGLNGYSIGIVVIALRSRQGIERPNLIVPRNRSGRGEKLTILVQLNLTNSSAASTPHAYSRACDPRSSHLSDLDMALDRGQVVLTAGFTMKCRNYDCVGPLPMTFPSDPGVSTFALPQDT